MVGIIILNYNNPQITIDCFESIEKYNTAPCKYVIVDNASTDNSVEVIDRYFSERDSSRYTKFREGAVPPTELPVISLIVANLNTGYACGNNLGCFFVEQDESIDKILILNNDILFIQDIVPSMADFIDTHKQVGIVGALLMEKNGEEFKYASARKNCTIGELFAVYAHISSLTKKYVREHQILLKNPELLEKECIEIEIPIGACMLISKALFKEIEYFDPHTFLYYEENILFRKIERKGFKNYLLPHQKVIHMGGETIKTTKFSYFQEKKKSYSAYYYGMHYSGMNPLLKPLFWIVYQYHLMRLGLHYMLKR
ncbi:MAG: glycosyltransferase family 2 protein [Bacteroidaceae bacterium]|nr:glycosyltransferase family 2 protein [Bacteroidaceae bacterium]